MKVAIVHDFLNQFGGAERVLEAIHEIFPYAPIYTSLYDPARLPLRMKNWDIRPFKLPKLPLAHFLKYYTAFYPLLFEGLDLSDYDLVISSTAFFAKGILTRPGAVHISYIHTPPRFLYHYETTVNRRRLWVYKPVLAVLDNFFRIWDYQAAQRPDYLVTNSRETASRIRKFYRRDATVIYPPVSLPERQNRQITGGKPGGYFLIVSRLLKYKRIDLAISAANLLGIPLKIVGTGEEEGRLKEIAGPTVEFLGFVRDESLPEIYSNCQAFIFPTFEDFGITPLEAMHYGKPVIALAKAGALETVLPGKTGEFFPEQTVESLAGVLKDFDPSRYSPAACIAQAQKFSEERFKKEFSDFVESKLATSH